MMPTMVTPGQASVCFSCGQPLPANIAGGGGAPAPTFPLTGAMAAQPPQPPANPYAAAPASATIIGAPGQFSIQAGFDVRVGRDPAQCQVCLQEPRVSGVHATLKLDGGQLLVKDEQSNNGTYIENQRIAIGQWTLVPPGARLRFGPIEFNVRVGA
jgi:pSer/pThr/pTyr-binding forkhead associated (FHA) protein